MRTSWERLATDFHLLEHAEKARFAHATHADFPRGAEILGSYVVGTVSVQPKVDARRQEAEKVMGRIKFLPEDLYARLQDVKLFANSKVNYGLVAFFSDFGRLQELRCPALESWSSHWLCRQAASLCFAWCDYAVGGHLCLAHAVVG